MNQHAHYSFPSRARRYLIAGILVLTPLWVTWLVLDFLFTLLSRAGKPWVQAFTRTLQDVTPSLAQFLSYDWLESAIAVVLTLLVLYLLGWATTQMLAKRLIGNFESLLERVPLVQAIYGSTKKLLAAFQTTPAGVQRVVLLDFPSPPLKVIGLVTRVMTDTRSGRELAVVYVPTSPNPTSGYMEIVPVENLVSTDLTLDEAMRFIITGGTSAPDRIDFGHIAAPPVQQQSG
jgi:uncharacterized membrane protein